MKSFLSQANKIHHVLSNISHNLSGYTAKTMAGIMKKTLINGTIGVYKSVQIATLATLKSQVTFTIIRGVIYISDMWIM